MKTTFTANAVLLVLCVLLGNNTYATHALPLINVRQTINTESVIIDAQSDPNTFGGSYRMEVELIQYGPSFSGQPNYFSLTIQKNSALTLSYPSLSIPFNTLVPGATYKWRAREHVITSGNRGVWSAEFTFTVPKPDILLLASDVGGWIEEVRTKLNSTGAFNSVSIFNSMSTTPTLAFLTQFDAVLVWTNFSVSNPTLMGDILAEYIDGGGGVVSAVFNNASVPILGRYNTDTYLVIKPLAQTQGSRQTLGSIFIPSHPTMRDVSAFDGGTSSYRSTSTTLTPGSARVANWSDGLPLIAVKENVGPQNIRRADLNFFPPSIDSRSDFWVASSDGAVLMKNALLWVTNSSSTSTIATSSAISNTLCLGAAVDVSFSAAGVFNSGNIFTAQLSDAAGSFMAPLNIGVLAATTSGIIRATIPPNTTTAARYRIRVVSSNPQVIGSDNGRDITVFDLPTASITGSASICPGGSTNLTINSTGSGLRTVTYRENDAIKTVTTSADVHSLTVSPEASTVYTLVSISDQHCSANVTGSAEVTVNSLPVMTLPTIAPVNNESGKCEASVPFQASAIANPPATIIYKIGESEITSPHIFPAGVTTVTAIASNECGSDTRSFTVTVRDAEAPVPQISSLPVISAQCSATLTPPTALDNCAGIVVGTTSNPTSYEIQGNFTVTWVYNDGRGNSTPQTQQVIIHDVTPPELILPDAISVRNDNDVCGAAVDYEIPAPTDNCVVGDVIEYNLTGVPYSPFNMSGAALVGFPCDDCQFGPVVLPYRFNFYGNDFTEVHVYPSTNGFISFQRQFSSGCCSGQALPNANFPNSIFAAWSDWITTIQYKVFGSAPNRIAVFQIAGGSFSGGGEVNTQIALHETTNQVQLVYTTVSNTTYVRTAGLNKNGITAHPVPGRNATRGWTTQNESLMFTPNYGPSLVQIEGLPSGSVFPIGKTTNTFRATDAAGNITTRSFDVTVVDEQLPTVLTQNISVALDERGEASIISSRINNGSTDNCAIPENGYAIDISNFTCADVGENTVTLTVTDVNGNFKSATAIVTVEDNIMPVAVGKNITVQLDQTGHASIVPQDVDNGSSDICGILSLALSKSDFTCEDVGANTVTLIVTDNNGNPSAVDVVVTVEDNVLPDAQCQSIEVYLSQAGDVSITPAQIDNESSDACGIASLVLSRDYFNTSDVGLNKVTLTVTDNNENVSSCEADVTIKKRPVILTYTSVQQVQYSDLLVFTATLMDELTNTALPAKNITFTLGTQTISAVTDANGTATASLIIDQGPGNHTLVSGFAGDDIYLPGIDNDAFEIRQEDARVTYTGALFASTSSASSSAAKVTLSATIQDITAVSGDPAFDADPGDIINASVTFMIVETGQMISAPIGYVVSGDHKTGTATVTWNVDIGTKESDQFTVRIQAGNYYIRNASEDNTVITVSKPLNDFVTGGGYIVLASSSGEKAGDAGRKNNFGFNIKYNKKGTNLQGNINTIIRRTEVDGVLHVYQIKGNVMSSLSVQPTSSSTGTAVFNGKANIQDITDPIYPVSVDGNATLQVEMTDLGEGGLRDEIALTVWNKSGGLWFASNWNGSKTIKQMLGGGNIVVRGGAIAAVADATQTTDGGISQVSAEPTFLLESYPNPFNIKTEIRFSMLHAVAYTLEIFDMRGINIKTLGQGIAEPGKIYQAEFDATEYSSGVYLARLKSEAGMRYIKLIVR